MYSESFNIHGFGNKETSTFYNENENLYNNNKK